jgi:tetratricopeptide (TPR) repeat protein
MRTPTLLFFLVSVGAASADFHDLIHRGQGALAKADIVSAAGFYEQACNAQPEATLPPERRATCEHHLAIVDEARGDLAQAEARLLKALNEWRQAGPPFEASYAMSLINLGELYRRQRRYIEAEPYLLQAKDLASLCAAGFPQLYPTALSRLAGLYAESNRPDQGRSLLHEAIAIFQSLAPAQNAELARALDALGVVDLAAGKPGAAAARLAQAVDISVSASGDGHPNTAEYQSDLALALIQQQLYDRAEPLLRRARYIVESQPFPNNLRRGTILAELSMVACGQRRFAMAEEYASQALEVFNHAPVANPIAILLARIGLSAAWIEQRRLAEAEGILPAAVAEGRKVAPDSCILADGLRQLAALRALRHSSPEAVALYKEAIDIYERRLGKSNPIIVPVLREYAGLLKKDGSSKGEAKALESRAKAIMGLLPPA